MRYQKEFDQIDRFCEEVSSKVKDLKKVLSVQAFINEEKNENNDFTQLGIKLLNLYALRKQQAKINKFCQELKHRSWQHNVKFQGICYWAWGNPTWTKSSTTDKSTFWISSYKWYDYTNNEKAERWNCFIIPAKRSMWPCCNPLPWKGGLRSER